MDVVHSLLDVFRHLEDLTTCRAIFICFHERRDVIQRHATGRNHVDIIVVARSFDRLSNEEDTSPNQIVQIVEFSGEGTFNEARTSLATSRYPLYSTGGTYCKFKHSSISGFGIIRYSPVPPDTDAVSGDSLPCGPQSI